MNKEKMITEPSLDPSSPGAGYDPQYDTKEERRVITGSEAETAESNGESIRNDHKGTPYRTVSPTSTKPF